ncbi:MAG: 23S rRNA (adenine(2503)-C(2))-methyltransferase [Candidatus Melainabacteria bacterium RIFCSPHIGHO2_02_FULL_34_12]|nr:MAG: 23S rRNA (adenine(2503)-C(2))-methyltransferase [Candidatus Melainabacteria bacterium RIFCSPHIGHO2_02_FULL_34_12]
MTTNTHNPTCLSGLSEPELIKLTEKMNWPSYKGKQLHSWIYKKWASSFDEMSDFSLSDRKILGENFTLSTLKLSKKQESKDKTIKYLWELNDKKLVESVRMFMEDHDSYSACISSQAGCAIGCPFCATGAIGFKRNLKSNEILDQILAIQRDTKERINNIVFMGQGEPLLNYNELIKSIKLIRESINIGARHITVSTSGIVPQIKKLADEKLQITLALSLHAPDQNTREFLVPISRKYKMKELLESLYYYYEKTKRRITIEYVMLEGINDQIEKAKELADLLRNLHCHINLIPYNPTDNNAPLELKRPANNKIYKFKEVLEKTSRKKVTVRQERGTDISAACGQLANQLGP